MRVKVLQSQDCPEIVNKTLRVTGESEDDYYLEYAEETYIIPKEDCEQARTKIERADK